MKLHRRKLTHEKLKSINIFNNTGAKILYYSHGNKDVDLTSLPKGINNVIIEQENGAVYIKRVVVE